MGINFVGSYSGIDQGTIDQLMAVEKMPLVQMSEKKTAFESEKYAWKDVNTRLDSLMTKLKELKYTATYMTKSATSSDASVVTGTATSSALNGSYRIEVGQLASVSRFTGSKVLVEGQDNSTELGLSGAFTLDNADGVSVEIAVEATDSLGSIADKINDQSGDTGVEATVIDGRMVFQDKETGERNMTLTGVDTFDLNSLGLDTGSVMTLGGNAEFSVNGIDIIRSSNTITDAVEGLSFTLSGETSLGSYETLTVGLDTAGTVGKVQAFVDQYNSTLSFMQDMNSVGDLEADVTGAGALAGDPTLQRMISSLRTNIAGSISGLDSSIGDLSQLGIKTVDKYGQLTFDSSKLVTALNENAENVKNFFYSTNTEDVNVGFEVKMESYINSLIATGTGIVEVKEDGLSRSLKDLDDQIERFNDRMDVREQYYLNMFAKLDVAMQQAEAQMSWLTSQLAGLSGNTAE
ncbi:MAG: flagellar filament capping protein FliD [Clostridiales bacterium]|nr:flagellar filament capping protein FliD [Clostridiales bacterium]